MSAPATFDGFGPCALAFLVGLDADNSKAYFDANRATYDTQVAAPLKSLVNAVGDELSESVDHELSYDPRIGKSLFRINRDLRFSKDKTPYHTHLDAIWWTGETAKQSAAFIMRITSDSLLTGAGMRVAKGEPLERYRAAVAAPAGTELAEIVDSLERELGASLSEPSRKRVPKGFDADHERAHLLVRDGFHVSVEEPFPVAVTTADFAPAVADRLARFADLHSWFATHL